jgi:hypothetical protein
MLRASGASAGRSAPELPEPTYALAVAGRLPGTKARTRERSASRSDPDQCAAVESHPTLDVGKSTDGRSVHHTQAVGTQLDRASAIGQQFADHFVEIGRRSGIEATGQADPNRDHVDFDPQLESDVPTGGNGTSIDPAK